MTDHPSDPSLEAFEKKLEKAKKKHAAPDVSPMHMALRLGAEFVSGVLVGVGIGWLFDHWFDTRPWFMVICLLLGTAAGVKTMMQTVARYEAAHSKNEQE